jgi:hypothetical protein
MSVNQPPKTCFSLLPESQEWEELNQLAKLCGHESIVRYLHNSLKWASPVSAVRSELISNLKSSNKSHA